jgi:hypothetical protein
MGAMLPPHTSRPYFDPPHPVQPIVVQICSTASVANARKADQSARSP